MARNLENVIVTNNPQSVTYRPNSGFPSFNYPNRTNPIQHGNRLLRDFSEIKEKNEKEKDFFELKFTPYKEGFKLLFKGKEEYDLKLESLENQTKKIRVINSRTINGITEATVFIPNSARSFFLERITDYLTKTTGAGKRKHADLINSIEEISDVVVTSFWTDGQSDMPKREKIWCECWLWYEGKGDDAEQKEEIENTLSSFQSLCKKLNIEYQNQQVIFSECIITLALVNKEDIEKLVKYSNQINEIRKNSIPNKFFIEENTVKEQWEWIEDLLDRVEIDLNDTSPAICILDTGISSEHPLIKPFILSEDTIQSAVEPFESTKDLHGHGTEMAGLAIFFDLKEALMSQNEIKLNLNIESVKILPDPTIQCNPEELYGYITEQAIYRSEIENSNNTIYCMAVTSYSNAPLPGMPTQWSSSVDLLSYGDDSLKRLIVISGGNIHPIDYEGKNYPDFNLTNDIQDPAQSWNALTIGAYNNSSNFVEDLPEGFVPVAKPGEISPYSTSSYTLDRKSPVKPEVVFDGGTTIKNNFGDYDNHDDLSLLTTGIGSNKAMNTNLFSTIHGTSSATAQASHFASKIWGLYPNVWPETIKALMVHSAEWTEEMKQQFLTDTRKTGGIKKILRSCGYGVPQFEKAAYSQSNSVNLIVESNIQPFIKENAGDVKYNEMHFYELPWPKEELEKLGNEEVRVKITLSYFIDPSPDNVGWSSKYIYPSYRLGFDLKGSTESDDEFKARVNKALENEDNESKTPFSSSWFIGSQNRNNGSIHSDFIETTAIQLSDTNLIGIYPMSGWWKTRKQLKKYNNSARYSLIISIETIDSDTAVDLYTNIMTNIETSIEV